MTAVAPRPRVTAPQDAAALVDAAIDGDELAWLLLTELHMGSIRAVAMARLRDEHAADDVVQETLMRAWTRLHQLEDAHRLGAWLKTIAANVAIDHLRSRRHAEQLDDLDEPLGAIDHVEAHIVERDEARVLHGHLAELREQDRVALWQRDALGSPIAEVAEKLGMTDGSVRVLLTRARGKVRAGYAALVAPLLGLAHRLRAQGAGLGEAFPIAIVAPVVVVAATVGIIVPSFSAGAQPAELPSFAAPAPEAPVMLVEAVAGSGAERADEVLTRARVSDVNSPAGTAVAPSAAPAPREAIAEVGNDDAGVRVDSERPEQDPDIDAEPEAGPVDEAGVYLGDTVQSGGVTEGAVCGAVATCDGE